MIIEVACALPERQHIVRLELIEPISIQEAIRRSNILRFFPELVETQYAVGIWGQICEVSTFVKEGDRVELYRPVLIDPIEARRLRLKKRPFVKRQRG